MSRRVRFCQLLAVAAVAVSAFAQGASPSAAIAQPQTTPSSIATLEATAQLVVVDVVVTDSKQNPIHGLNASDFTLLEDGVPQQITGFEEYSAPTAAQLAKATMPYLQPGIFTNYSPVPAGAINILLLDALNTQMKDQAYVRNQLLDFIRKAVPGTRIAIFGLSNRFVMLQGITSDLTLLKLVLDRSKPGSSNRLTDPIGNGGGKPLSQQLSDVSQGNPNAIPLIESLAQMEAVQAATDSQIRARATLDAMNQLAHYLAGIPGRKNLIWFSGSFPLDVFPQGGIKYPFATVMNSEDEFRQTTDLLSRSQVAVYTIDASGVQTDQAAVADTPTNVSMSPQTALHANVNAFESRTEAHSTLSRMAADTGGHAYLNTNGLADAVAKAIDNGSNYYTLSYIPSIATHNGDFRKIQVSLARPGVSLAYRSGYFAASARHLLPAGGSIEPNPFVKAMLRGAPDATEVHLKVRVTPATSATETTVAKDNILSPEPVAKEAVKGPFRRYVIEVAADPHDIFITRTRDGHYAFAIELRTFVYEGNGRVVNVTMQKAHGNLTRPDLVSMVDVGLPFRQEISVPAAGEYYLRTSLNDLNTDRFGTVEIPVAWVEKLVPLAASIPRD